MASDALASLASQREVHAAFDWFRRNENALLEQQIAMLSIPAPPFGEAERAEWLRSAFTRAGLRDVHLDAVGNVIGVHRGTPTQANGAVMLSAHIDTVFPAGTSYQVIRSGGGYGTRIDAPGSSDNSVGVIALLAVAQVLTTCKLQHRADTFFVGNVGEEGEGDLRGMRQIFASELSNRIAYTLVLDGTGTDTIVTQALGSRRFDVKISGPGGHSWLDHGKPNPVNALARAIALLQDTPVPNEPRTSVNVGMISGGTSVNTIPQFAFMRVDIRSAKAEEVVKLEDALHRCLQASVSEQLRRTHSKRDALSFEISVIGDRPSGELAVDSQLLATLRAVDAHLGIRAHTKRSSTDANIPLSLGKEAVSIGAGGTGGGAHTPEEWFDAAGRDLALKRILLTALLLTG
ncbi:MAG: M20/M25/M40 family metallo-hydrolase [Acidobacteriaceae bacterium]